MGQHYDLIIENGSGVKHAQVKRAEVKVTQGTPSPLTQLQWRPWMDTVQFLQGQLKSAIGRRFLGECGEPMMKAWYDTRVMPCLRAKNLASVLAMTCDGYMKALFTIGMKGKQEQEAKNFIQMLRSTPELQKEFQASWLAFETEWFQTHTPDHDGLLAVVKEVIEVKDAWICISKEAPQWIDKLEVLGLTYQGVRQKPRGGSSFHYTLSMRRGEETKDVPLECKFHWKNGGQAVQNPNFLLL